MKKRIIFAAMVAMMALVVVGADGNCAGEANLPRINDSKSIIIRVG